ncbi:MAG: acyl-CoA dehydrogenase family protein, partial [Pseudomonadota bacterium]
MKHHKPHTHLQTHEVSNQPPAFCDINLYEADPGLAECVAPLVGQTRAQSLSAFGAQLGDAETLHHATLANRFAPELRAFDRYGHRLDEVEFHPAYHALMSLGIEAQVASAAWTQPTHGHVEHMARLYLMFQAESGVCCPLSMTYAAVPALRAQPELAAFWEPKIAAAQYDARFVPAEQKAGVTLGMAMTEKQGGSDVRANTTRGTATGDGWRLTGHKWFCSAPMCDAFLTLAYSEQGLSCFLVPRWSPDDTRNTLHIMRLKDKLGDRSNASSEIEYHNAFAWLVGEAGRGVRTIIDMVQHTRLDCIIGSAAGMRMATVQAIWHARHRTAFQKRLVDQAAMKAVLADLALECEAARATAFRIARAFDAAASDETESALVRLATPAAKYRICKRQPGVVYEALECHGGAGFIEEG